MMLLKYLLVAVALLSGIVAQLLAFVPSVWQERSSFLFAGCFLTVFVFALLALIRKRWHALAIFCLALAVSLLGSVTQPGHWLRATGFRIYASPIEQYLSGCRLSAFVEDGKQQQVGECEGIPTSEITWVYVIYDTRGQLLLPRAHRTQEWKNAVLMLSSPDVYIEAEGRASRLYGDFYTFPIRIDELRGG